MGVRRRLVRRQCAACGAVLDHRLWLKRTESGAAGLRFHLASRVRIDEHLRGCRGRTDQIRCGDRGCLHRMLACNAVLAALNARHRTNKGQKVEVSLYETSLAMLVNVASSYLISGKDAGRYGNGHPSIVPYTTYKAADQMFAVAVGNDGQFRKFAECVGHPEWADDPRFAVNSSRVENRQFLDKLVAEVLAGQPAEFWLGTLKAAGIPCGMINTVAQALQDPHTQARAMVETVAHPTAGPVKILGIPLKFSDTPASIRAAPPTLGQHSDEILQNMLGYDAVRIARLRANRTI